MFEYGQTKIHTSKMHSSNAFSTHKILIYNFISIRETILICNFSYIIIDIFNFFLNYYVILGI